MCKIAFFEVIKSHYFFINLLLQETYIYSQYIRTYICICTEHYHSNQKCRTEVVVLSVNVCKYYSDEWTRGHTCPRLHAAIKYIRTFEECKFDWLEILTLDLTLLIVSLIPTIL